MVDRNIKLNAILTKNFKRTKKTFKNVDNDYNTTEACKTIKKKFHFPFQILNTIPHTLNRFEVE